MVAVDILLTVAIVGTVSSTVVLFLSILGAIKFRRSAQRDRKTYEKWAAKLPPVSILKPVHGNEAQLKENLESFFLQDYPQFEILFAADEADDAVEAPVADLLPVAPAEPDDLERQLAKDEEMERQNRHEHHEAPHFRKESD